LVGAARVDLRAIFHSPLMGTIDGKSYTYELGLTDIGDGTAFGNLYSSSIALLAAGDNTGNSSDPPENYVHISIGSSNPGTYTTAFDSILGFYYRENDVAYYPQTPLPDQTTTVIINTIEEVGGMIEGTFTGYVTNGSIDKTLENGVIKLKRIEDDSFSLFP